MKKDEQTVTRLATVPAPTASQAATSIQRKSRPSACAAAWGVRDLVLASHGLFPK